MNVLASLGGTPVRDTKTSPWPRWPVFGQPEEAALIEVLRSGVWSYNGPKERAFNRAFADFIGTRYCVSVASGTVALQLALEACGVGFGHEVIIPGLTWQATATCALDVNAVPVLVDVCEDTWCIDPNEVEKAIGPRTKAIVPVHLYGSFCDMDRITEIADRHDLRVIEDCAHKHGAEWKGRKAGSLGHIGCFSFQLSKLLTAGEGGALTTDDPALWERLDALRNCGRRPRVDSDAEKGAGVYADEGNFLQSGGYRITDFQAALLLGGLERLPEQNQLREQNALYLNQLLSEIPGIVPLRRDERETREAYYNFAFRFLQDQFKGLEVERFREALSRELGCSVEACSEPLNSCQLYTPHTKPWRYKLGDQHWQDIDPRRFHLPNCRTAHERESICLHFATLMGSRSDTEQVAEAVHKIYTHAEDLL